MNRLYSTLTVFGILLVAVALGIRQTLATGSSPTLLAVQGFIGAGLITGSALLVRQRHARRSRRVNGAAREADGSLRRLLSTVWS